MVTFKFNKHKYSHPLAMDFFRIEENDSIFISKDVHETDFFEILIFDRVKGYILLANKKIELKKQTSLFISPYQKRQWFVNKKSVRGWALIFEKDFLGNFFSDKLFVYKLQYFYNLNVKTAFNTTEESFPIKEAVFKEIQQEIIAFKSDSTHILRSLLYYVLVKLNRSFCQFYHLENETQSNNYGFLFKEALEKNYRKFHKVNDYVSILSVSRITLNQSVKNQFNCTVSEMIKERLVSEVKSQLIHTTKTISEIAFELEFTESNNLIRLFENKTGMSPKNYRLSKR